MTPEEISLINLASSVLLTIVTAIYVFLTYKLLNQTKELNDKQMNLTTLPLLKCKITKIVGRNAGIHSYDFKLINYGNQPGFDVDVFIIGVCCEEVCSIADLQSKYLKIPLDLTPFDSEFFGIYDRLLFPYFPSKTKMCEHITFPIEPDSFWVYVQYRNVLKTNFSQLFWFIENQKTNELSLGSALDERDITEPTPRLEIEIFDVINDKSKNAPFNLISEKKDKIPEFLDEFRKIFSHSVSRGHLNNSDFVGCEGRGTFSDIK
jgi:hypothetical protein